MNDNAASTAVIDETGNHNGTYTSVGGNANTEDHDVLGRVNNALDFVGDDDHVVVGDNVAFTPALTPFSIIADIFMHDATNFVIASKGVYNTDGEWYFTLVAEQLQAILFDESVDNCRIGRSYNTNLTSLENSWIQVGFSYGGEAVSSSVKIYINGKRVDDTDEESGTFVSVENLAGDVRIGRVDSNYSNGVIDNLKFFNKELSVEEFKRFYNNGHSSELLSVADESRRDLRRRER